ncbi:hypothetical protein Droror1_Dr00016585 [Drosera rotundifolia]
MHQTRTLSLSCKTTNLLEIHLEALSLRFHPHLTLETLHSQISFSSPQIELNSLFTSSVSIASRAVTSAGFGFDLLSEGVARGVVRIWGWLDSWGVVVKIISLVAACAELVLKQRSVEQFGVRWQQLSSWLRFGVAGLTVVGECGFVNLELLTEDLIDLVRVGVGGRIRSGTAKCEELGFVDALDWVAGN